MKNALALALSGFLLLAVEARLPAQEVSLSIDPGKVINRIDEKVYGHFLEHIYHSVNGGLWGEMIWNRSFEEWPGRGRWSVEDGTLVQRSPEADVRLLFGDPAWTDYELALEAQKLGGQEGFLVIVRAKDDENFYWYNLGGWGNVRHALERGQTGQRQHPVGQAAEGRIERGRWYKIRLRAEGPRIQAWLDGKQVLDFTDGRGAHLAGRVGLGTWNTQARFRNLKVTELDGKVLFEGLPRLEGAMAVSKYWSFYGQGEAAAALDDPLNSEMSQMIVSRGPEAGIEQTPLCLPAGETFRGSLWARGQAPQGLIVRLVDGQATLAEQKLPAPTGQWSEYPLVLRVDRAAPQATIRVGVVGEGKVWIDQVSLMPDAARATGGFRPDLLEAIAALRPPVIRWPGGCFAEWYRWKDGVGPQHRRVKYPISIWDDVDTNSFGTDEFVAMCRKVGAEPLIVVNIGSHMPAQERPAYIREACDWIEYCNGPADSKWGGQRAANGHAEPYGVKFWEIDSETWFMGAEAYAEAVRQFAPAMRKSDPSIKLAACGSGGYGRGGNGLAWNRVIIDRCADVIDYLSIHHYENPNRFAEGPAAYEQFFRETGRLIAGSKNPDLKIDVSEWNAQSTDWRTGLYAGGLLNAFERCGDVLEIGGPALFLRHVSATAWDNAFVNFDHRRWFPAPNYVVMKLWRDHYAPQRVALEGDTRGLSAVATRSADGKTLCLKAVNPTREAVSVALAVGGEFAIGTAALEQVAPGSLDARNTLDRPDAVKPAAVPVEVQGQKIRFTLPPLSVAVLTIARR